MDILEKQNLCYDYFVTNNINNRNQLRMCIKNHPLDKEISQSFIENMFSMFKKSLKTKKINKKCPRICTTVCLSDMHIPNHDIITCDLVFDCIIDLQPNNIVLLGDILDCYWSSKFLKNPNNKIYIQEEADIFYNLFSKLRRKCKNTNIYYVLGNHEERLLKSQWEHPQYIGLRALEPNQLLRLDKLNIQLYKNKLVLNDFIFYHGDKVRSNSSYSAKAELEGFQMNSGISGHTHRLGCYHHSCDKNVESWYENGCLCTLDPEYINPPKINWQQGFSIINSYDGINQVEQILIQNHKFRYNGVLYHDE